MMRPQTEAVAVGWRAGVRRRRGPSSWDGTGSGLSGTAADGGEKAPEGRTGVCSVFKMLLFRLWWMFRW